jgi:nitroreductase
MIGLPEGSFLVGLSSIFWREAWKYGERAFRYCQHDVGHALGTLRSAAAALGWKLFLLDYQSLIVGNMAPM